MRMKRVTTSRWCNCAHDPCAGARSDTGTSTDSSISRAPVLTDLEALVLVPIALCLRLDRGGFISFLHGYAAEYLKMRTRRELRQSDLTIM